MAGAAAGTLSVVGALATVCAEEALEARTRAVAAVPVAAAGGGVEAVRAEATNAEVVVRQVRVDAGADGSNGGGDAEDFSDRAFYRRDRAD